MSSERKLEDTGVLRPLYPVFGVVAAALVAIDLFDLWGRIYSPKLLAEDACVVWHDVHFLQQLLYATVADHVDHACGIEAEPASSIILFVAKLAFAMIAVPLAWIITLATPGMIDRLNRHTFRSIEEWGGYTSALKQMGSNLALMWVLVAAGVMFCGSYEGPLRLSIQEKIVEDITAFLMFFLGWGALKLGLGYALYPSRTAKDHHD